ncbi:hypothetical protein BYT27DRAFT_7251691 [Phlegmacium glaucopus]|nr:hypothetical protein BYT27DRAFT_7251691 [Phlegmacium glaucopus]
MSTFSFKVHSRKRMTHPSDQFWTNHRELRCCQKSTPPLGYRWANGNQIDFRSKWTFGRIRTPKSMERNSNDEDHNLAKQKIVQRSTSFNDNNRLTTMGRRKIEIQPITHERNRSVSALGLGISIIRKYDLFRKSYELGVLCSVDVAIIIFEKHPEHHHDGEKDTRGPADLSGNNPKINDMSDGDDDDDVQSRSNMRVRDGKLKPSPGNGHQYDHRGLAIPQPPTALPMHPLRD